MNRSEDRAPRQELFEPRSLEWQENGELASTEMFELVKRLRAVESGKTVNELWRLSQKALGWLSHQHFSLPSLASFG